MRRFLRKLKKSTKSKYVEIPSSRIDISYTELLEKTNRGFLAKKIAKYAGVDPVDWDRLIYTSLTRHSFTDGNSHKQNEYFLSLSEQMLRWNFEHININKAVKSLNIHPDIKNAMLLAYEDHKKDLFLPLSKTTDKGKTQKLQKKQNEWRIYRDVMFAATQGQFLLITEEEIEKYKDGNVFCEGVIKETADIPKCRNLAKEQFEQIGLHNSQMTRWLLALSEALTNTIKHAEQGKMTLIENKKNNEIIFIIEDEGPGFTLEDLPKKILLAGYSTKRSLGQGFTLMTKMAKHILLCTTHKGSTIILIFEITEEKERQLEYFRKIGI